MNKSQIGKVRQELRSIRQHASGRKAQDIEALARQVGREKDNRGKEPTWVRKRDPALSPPLSIPHHSKDMAPGTVRCIIDQLLDDLDEWELFLSEQDEDDKI